MKQLKADLKKSGWCLLQAKGDGFTDGACRRCCNETASDYYGKQFKPNTSDYITLNQSCKVCQESAPVSCPILCIDNIDEFGQMYGGCYKICNEEDEKAAFAAAAASKPVPKHPVDPMPPVAGNATKTPATTNGTVNATATAGITAPTVGMIPRPLPPVASGKP